MGANRRHPWRWKSSFTSGGDNPGSPLRPLVGFAVGLVDPQDRGGGSGGPFPGVRCVRSCAEAGWGGAPCSRGSFTCQSVSPLQPDPDRWPPFLHHFHGVETAVPGAPPRAWLAVPSLFPATDGRGIPLRFLIPGKAGPAAAGRGARRRPPFSHRFHGGRTGRRAGVHSLIDPLLPVVGDLGRPRAQPGTCTHGFPRLFTCHSVTLAARGIGTDGRTGPARFRFLSVFTERRSQAAGSE